MEEKRLPAGKVLWTENKRHEQNAENRKENPEDAAFHKFQWAKRIPSRLSETGRFVHLSDRRLRIESVKLDSKSLDELGKRQPNCPAVSMNFDDIHAPLAGLAFGNIRLRLTHAPRDFQLCEARSHTRRAQVLQEHSIFIGVQRFRLWYRLSPEGKDTEACIVS
jgi:hypothetical protein